MGMAKTPVYSHFTDSVYGRETLAAYGAEARFTERNHGLLRVMSRASLATLCTLQWANQRHVQLGTIFYGMATYTGRAAAMGVLDESDRPLAPNKPA